MSSYTTSYAQNREDVIMDAFFDGKTEGFYVDVGANHPTIDSVTKLFYEKGWRGVDIEPNKELSNLLKVDRPEDIVVVKGVSNKKGKALLRQYNNADGLSTFSEKMKSDKDEYYDQFKQDYVDIETPVETLETILAETAKNKKIDFLKIDVEGYEYEVIEGNDWKKYRPELVCVEADHIEKDWRPILEKNRYKLVFDDGLNNYYATEESKRAKEFSFPKQVLMHYPKIVPFISNADKVSVSEDCFNEVAIPVKTEKTSAKQAIKWSLLGLDAAIHGGLQHELITLKRVILRAKIKQNISSGNNGRLAKNVRIISSKVQLIRFVLIIYTVFAKVGNKLLGAMK